MGSRSRSLLRARSQPSSPCTSATCGRERSAHPGLLDYVATELPKAGDVLGGARYLDDASPWSFSIVCVLPVAPL
jgi:hypothetical protein